MDMSGRARGRGGDGARGGRGHGDQRSEYSSEAGSSSIDTTGRSGAAKRKSDCRKYRSRFYKDSFITLIFFLAGGNGNNGNGNGNGNKILTRGAVRGNRPITGVVRTKPSDATKKGTTGQSMMLAANYFKVNRKPDFSMNQYRSIQSLFSYLLIIFTNTFLFSYKQS